MGWETVYIRGNKGFQEVVLSKLNMAWLAGSTAGETNLLMFWLPQIEGLRVFKKTIGSRLIFKYRIKFFTNLDNYLNNLNNPSSTFADPESE
jgi:hypothetical protein